MASAFAFNIPTDILPDFGEQLDHSPVDATPDSAVWKPESYNFKPDIETEKKRESGRRAAKRYRDKVKVDKILLAENLQKLTQDNAKLTEENASLQKTLELYMERILQGIDNISAFIKNNHQRKETYSPVLSVPTVVLNKNPTYPSIPYGQLPSSISSFPPSVSSNTALRDTSSDHGYGTTNGCEYDSPFPASIHTTPDSHSMYNIFIFLFIFLLPAKLFPYITASYISAKNAMKDAQMFSAVTQQANFYAHSLMTHQPDAAYYFSHSFIANYSPPPKGNNSINDTSHQSGLTPMLDAYVQTTGDFLITAGESQKDKEATIRKLATISNGDLCRYYTSGEHGMLSTVVERIESEFKRTCSAKDHTEFNKDIITESL